MEATVSYLLIIQKCINSKQNTLKWNIIHCVYVIFQKISQLIIWKKEKKNRPKMNWKRFSVNQNAIGTNKILDIHR